MELQRKQHVHVNSCHMQIFKEIDQIKAKVGELQKTCQNQEGHGEEKQGQLVRNHHTVSVPTFRKITELDNWIVPGEVEYQYHTRHHLDDTQMKEALHWNVADSDDYVTVKHYDAHRQTYKHQKTEPAQDYYFVDKAKPTEPKHSNRERKIKTIQAQQKRQVQPERRIPQRSTKQVPNRDPSNLYKAASPKYKTTTGASQRTKTDMPSPGKSLNRQPLLKPKVMSGRDYETQQRVIVISREDDDYDSNQGQGQRQNFRTAADSNQHDRGLQEEDNLYRKKQQHYKSPEHYTISMRDRQNSGRYVQDYAYEAEHTSTRKRDNVIYSSSPRGGSQRKQGHLITRKRFTKHYYEEMSVSSDSYFSPYEDEFI